uniref:FIST signal transduction protein n=1 Tax=Thaumasiovibrio occultus TaxID=1891184 RepID=UPI000B351683|nr:FIST N-terminal domain-containing protein [Thaumasiovibrio occultus]
MLIATSGSDHRNTETAIDQAVTSLKRELSAPDFILVYHTQDHDGEEVRRKLTQHFPHSTLLGCTSSRGVLDNQAYYANPALALWGCSDPDGAFGSAINHYYAGQAFQTAQRSIKEAIEQSGRLGELPSLVLLHATPGDEEEIIAGIESVIGTSVPILGGSAADENIAGRWSILNEHQSLNKGIAIAAIYPNCEISLSFHSGYAATQYSAVATAVENREVIELNGRPAADVYLEWMQATHSDLDSDFFSDAGMHPLGRAVGEINGMAYYKLSHPFEITHRRGIRLFAGINQDERVYFMTGTQERLIKRAGKVIDSALGVGCTNLPVGGIAFYCAGCMLQVEEKLPQVGRFMYTAMHEMPFICPFTFGEQGQFIGGENAHGNLMISAVLFHRE